jgi:hypothetical protein
VAVCSWSSQHSQQFGSSISWCRLKETQKPINHIFVMAKRDAKEQQGVGMGWIERLQLGSLLKDTCMYYTRYPRITASTSVDEPGVPGTWNLWVRDFRGGSAEYMRSLYSTTSDQPTTTWPGEDWKVALFSCTCNCRVVYYPPIKCKQSSVPHGAASADETWVP